jgi:alpha-L-fucosidase
MQATTLEHAMKPSLFAVIILLSVIGGFVPQAYGQQTGNESPEQRDSRMQWWREARFGMFIHWGVYAVPAGTYKGQQVGGIGEWIMRQAEIPVTEYRAMARQFNPVKYDPEAWAALAEEAGMKYIVITSKHHDGFALFPSDVTDWDVADATPYGKDLIGPLAAAARRHGLKFGLYYSQAQDWTNPGGAKAGLQDGEGWCEEHKGSLDEYLQKIAAPQTREILTRYKPDILWWDTPFLMTRERADLLRPLLALRPGIISNNRLGGDYAGDTDTPEQSIPATGIAGRDWETCMTMNDTWGYKSYDNNWKSTETLIRNLVDIASKGGNYLLNVGPKADGTMPEASIERLRAVGRWMKTNGQAIYGTTASPTRRPGWGRVTAKVDKGQTVLYLLVFDWPTDGKLPVSVTNEVVSCGLLADASRSFDVTRQEDGLVVNVSGRAPDPICSVVVLTITGQPKVVVYRVPQQADGQLALSAVDAELHGELRIEAKDDKPNIGYWVNSDDWIEWGVRIQQPAEFKVVADIATMGESGLIVQFGQHQFAAKIPNTGDYATFQTVELGKIRIDQAGVGGIVVRPDKPAWSPVNIRSITLQPVR